MLPQWDIIDFHGTAFINAITVHNREDHSSGIEAVNPTHILFEISDDKSVWNTALDATGLDKTARTGQLLPLGTPVTGRYLKVTIVSNNPDGNDDYSHIAEIDIE
jgi:hypothetical protein